MKYFYNASNVLRVKQVIIKKVYLFIYNRANRFFFLLFDFFVVHLCCNLKFFCSKIDVFFFSFDNAVI